MAEAQKPLRHHSLQLEDRAVLRATGVSRVDFFSEELITAQTDQGQLHIKGEGLHIENLDSASGELLARGNVVIHIFTQEGRDFYDLDHLWADGKNVEWSPSLD